MAIKDGSKVKVEYTGSLEDGTVFDSSERSGQPLEFEIGAKQVIKGFEDAVKGLEVGGETEITLPPAEAYGDVNDEMHKEVPRSQLPKEHAPEKGMTLLLNLPNGQQFPARILEVKDETVTIDLNHPLAGKTLNFKLKLVEIV